MFNRLVDLVPLEPQRRATRSSAIWGRSTRAVVYGHSLTALAQGALVGIGFAIVRSALAGGVRRARRPCGVAAGRGRRASSSFQRCYTSLSPAAGARRCSWRSGALGIAVVDNVLRPFLTHQHAAVSTLTVFVGVIGGARRLRRPRTRDSARCCSASWSPCCALPKKATRSRRKARLKLEIGAMQLQCAPPWTSLPSSIR